MARIQLALNVSDLDEAVAFYSSLFGRRPARSCPATPTSPLHDPPLKLVLMEQPDGAGAGMVGTLNHLGVEVAGPGEVVAESARLFDGGPHDPQRIAGHLLLRRPGQGVGGRPRRHTVEIYTVLADAPPESGRAGDGTCCDSGACAAADVHAIRSGDGAPVGATSRSGGASSPSSWAVPSSPRW